MASFDNRPATLQLTAYYKGDYGLLFTFTSGGSPYTLTGATATFTIYDKTGTVALALTSSPAAGLTVSGSGGTVALAITNAQIVALNSQEYNYEFILTLTGGTVWPVLDSVFFLSEYGGADTSDTTKTVTSKGVTITITQN